MFKQVKQFSIGTKSVLTKKSTFYWTEVRYRNQYSIGLEVDKKEYLVLVTTQTEWNIAKTENFCEFVE